MNQNIKKFLPHLISVLSIILINILFFLPQFEGKVIQSSDMVQANGAMHDLVEYNKNHDDSGLWSSMFSGMPAYQIYAENNKSLWGYFDHMVRLGLSDPASSFIMAMLLFYLMSILIGIHPYLALLGSIGFGFCSNNFVLYEAGHLTKLWTICSIPLALGGAFLISNKKYLLGLALFAVGLGFNIATNHPQMTYYFGIALLPFVVLQLIKAVKDKAFDHLGKSVAVLLIGIVLAVGSNATSLWTTYEYSKDTMRGKPILEANGSDQLSTSVKKGDGLDWEYAMQWSNGTKDILSGIIPDFVGGASGRWLPKDADLVHKIGMNKPVQLPTYWGDLPFTSGPVYFGAALLLIFLFSAIAIKDSTVAWTVGAVLLTFLMSMGKHFEILNRFLFDYFPMFNKFRSPNSVLSITTIFISFLAIYGLHKIGQNKDRQVYIKPLLIAGGILGGFTLLMGLIGTTFFGFEGSADANYQNIIDALVDQRKSLFRTSSFRSFAFIALATGILYAYLKGKLKDSVAYLALGAVVLLDLFGIGKTYMPSQVFVRSSQTETAYQPREVDKQILQDKSLGYRVFDSANDPFQSTFASNFHRSLGGYHAAKLQRYQDLIVNHLSTGNQKVFDMLNTKYFIFKGKDEQEQVQQNPGALGAAWMVKNTKVVNSNNDEINALNTINPKEEAVIHKDFGNYISGLDTMAQGQIDLLSITPNKLEYDANIEHEGLAIFSEIWYGPNKGWQAYIDGKAVDHIRANYILRALRIPQGKHKIVFEFRPKTYYSSQNIGLVSTLLSFSLLGFALFKEWKGFEKSPLETESLSKVPEENNKVRPKGKK